MRTILMTTAAAVLLAQPLSAQQLSEQDKTFAEEAAQGGMLEVLLGELAQQQAKDQEVSEFGQMMVEDHGEANEKLKSIAEQKGIELPQELSQQGKQHKEELQQLSGAEFDRQYINLMVEDHGKDIKAFEQQVSEGQDPDLVGFAQATLPVLELHLQRAAEIKSKVSAAAGDLRQPGAGERGKAAAGQAEEKVAVRLEGMQLTRDGIRPAAM